MHRLGNLSRNAHFARVATAGFWGGGWPTFERLRPNIRRDHVAEESGTAHQYEERAVAFEQTIVMPVNEWCFHPHFVSVK